MVLTKATNLSSPLLSKYLPCPHHHHHSAIVSLLKLINIDFTIYTVPTNVRQTFTNRSVSSTGTLVGYKFTVSSTEHIST